MRKLADNFLVSSLSEVVSRQRPPKYPLCDFCKLLAGRERDAATKCLDCVKMLCASCTHQHRQTKVTSSHSLVDIDIEKVILLYYCRDSLSLGDEAKPSRPRPGPSRPRSQNFGLKFWPREA